MSDLRFGEVIIKCAGGKCCVCKERVKPGLAVQLSSKTNAIRHQSCMPKTDSRSITHRPSKTRWVKMEKEHD